MQWVLHNVWTIMPVMWGSKVKGRFCTRKVFLEFSVPVSALCAWRGQACFSVHQPDALAPQASLLAFCPVLPPAWHFFFFFPSLAVTVANTSSSPPPFRQFFCHRNELSFVTLTSDDMHMFCEHPQVKAKREPSCRESERQQQEEWQWKHSPPPKQRAKIMMQKKRPKCSMLL